MKRISVLAMVLAVLLMMTGPLWAMEQQPQPGNTYNSAYAGASASSSSRSDATALGGSALAFGGQGGAGGKATSSINAPLNQTVTVNGVPVTQTVNPAVTTQSVNIPAAQDQKVVPGSPSGPAYTVPPYVQSPGVVDTTPPASSQRARVGLGTASPRPYNMTSIWSKDKWEPTEIKPTGKVKGFEWKETYWSYGKYAQKEGSPMKALTIYNGEQGITPPANLSPGPRRTYRATQEGVYLFELEEHAMAWAQSINATGLIVLNVGYYLKNTQSGSGWNAGISAAILNSFMSSPTTFGPGIWYNSQNWAGMTEAMPTLEVEAVQ